MTNIQDPIELFKMDSSLPVIIYEKLYREGNLNPNEKDEDGETILHWFVYDFIEYGLMFDNRVKEFIEMLLRYGLDINVKNDMGNTILHIISKKNIQIGDAKKLRRYLLQKGANPNIPRGECAHSP